MIDFLVVLFIVSIIGIIISLVMKKVNNKVEKQNKIKGNKILLIISIILCVVSFVGIVIVEPDTEIVIPNINDDVIDNIEDNDKENNIEEPEDEIIENVKYDLSNLPSYSNSPYVAINGNVPYFEESDLTTESYEKYSELDKWKRCRVAMACIGIDIMPDIPREYIGNIEPTGWKQEEYENIPGGYLYNRCHLIGHQLTGENANRQNLITGTRYMNEEMLEFENQIADYIKETHNHVLYRVTPIFEGENKLASGVLMEAKSVEDDGKGILFNVYCYNVQPGIEIDYSTGSSKGPKDTDGSNNEADEENNYILNKSSMKFHKITCSSVETISEKNKEEYYGYRSELIVNGYEPCKGCNP